MKDKRPIAEAKYLRICPKGHERIVTIRIGPASQTGNSCRCPAAIEGWEAYPDVTAVNPAEALESACEVLRKRITDDIARGATWSFPPPDKVVPLTADFILGLPRGRKLATPDPADPRDR